MDFEGRKAQIEGWVRSVFDEDTDSILFDEVYLSVFRDVSSGEGEMCAQLLEGAFHDVVTEIRDAIYALDPGDAVQSFVDSCQRCVLAAGRLTACFSPIDIARGSACVYRSLCRVLGDVMFGVGGRNVSTFIKCFAHILPGSMEIASFESTIRIACDVNEELRKEFLCHLHEATEAYSLKMAVALSDDAAIKANVIKYFGAVIEVLEHEKVLWDIFPASEEVILRGIVIENMIYGMRNYIFTPENQERIGQTFFNGANFELFEKVIGHLFIEPELLDQMASTVILYLRNTLLKAITEGQGQAAQSRLRDVAIMETFADVSRMIELLEDTSLTSSMLSGAKEMVMALVNDNGPCVGDAMCSCLGHYIEKIYTSAVGTEAQWMQVQRCADFACYLSTYKNTFMAKYRGSLMIRTCKFAGQQWREENRVLAMLEAHFPPDLGKWFEAQKKDFRDADGYMKKWTEKDSPLRVFLVPMSTWRNVGIKFSKVTLPAEFQRMQDDFTNFALSELSDKRKKDGLQMKWIYEDNVVDLALHKRGCDPGVLTTALLVACVILLACDGEISMSDMTTKLGGVIPEKGIEALVSRGTREQAKIFNVRKVDGRNLVSINPGFSWGNRRISIPVSEQFQLKPISTVPANGQTPDHVFRACSTLIATVMKRNLRMTGTALRAEVNRRSSGDGPTEELWQRIMRDHVTKGYMKKASDTPETWEWITQ